MARPEPTTRQRATATAAEIALLIAGALFSAGCGPTTAPSTAPVPDGTEGRRATVVELVDGDTLDVRLGGEVERVRLLGIDTPETVKPDAPVECFGHEASERTAELVPAGTEVLLQRDEEARDRYGRLLVYLWRADDGAFVNEVLVREGFADTLFIEPNTARRSELSGAAATARAEGRGVWGACSPPS